jgi:hypothetical protein
MKFAAVAEFDVFADDAIRSDVAVSAELCLGMNDR